MPALKRSRGEDREVETLAMANCLKLLSRVGPSVNLDGRVYTCKICSKQFQSSQALGGHCARHKMPPLKKTKSSTLPAEPKLGGHMRRQRPADIKKGLNLLAVLKRSNSKRSLCLDLNLTPYERSLCLDLNLTPYENDLKMGFQMSSPVLI